MTIAGARRWPRGGAVHRQRRADGIAGRGAPARRLAGDGGRARRAGAQPGGRAGRHCTRPCRPGRSGRCFASASGPARLAGQDRDTARRGPIREACCRRSGRRWRAARPPLRRPTWPFFRRRCSWLRSRSFSSRGAASTRSAMEMLQGLVDDLNRKGRASSLFLPASKEGGGEARSPRAGWFPGSRRAPALPTGRPEFDPWRYDVERDDRGGQGRPAPGGARCRRGAVETAQRHGPVGAGGDRAPGARRRHRLPLSANPAADHDAVGYTTAWPPARLPPRPPRPARTGLRQQKRCG